MKQSKWYTIKITPVEADKHSHIFRIETSNLEKTMEKYTHNKEDNIVSTWEIIK